MAVVDNGNIDLGKKAPLPTSGRPGVEVLAAADISSLALQADNLHSKSERRRVYGAMSLQRGDSGRGNYSVPQEFLQLVGLPRVQSLA
jgi:hypothetical protein